MDLRILTAPPNALMLVRPMKQIYESEESTFINELVDDRL